MGFCKEEKANPSLFLSQEHRFPEAGSSLFMPAQFSCRASQKIQSDCCYSPPIFSGFSLIWMLAHSGISYSARSPIPKGQRVCRAAKLGGPSCYEQTSLPLSAIAVEIWRTAWSWYKLSHDFQVQVLLSSSLWTKASWTSSKRSQWA